jgi:endonuclease G
MNLIIVSRTINKKRKLLILFAVLQFFLVSTSCRHQDGGLLQAQIQGQKAKINHAEPSLAILGFPVPQGDVVLHRKAYVVSYSTENRIPNWVAWELTAEHADGKCPRDNHYYEDLSVPQPRPTNDDYRGVGKLGLSRGHMCPAADCKWDSVAMAETNLMTNICPQESGLNSGMWNQIEQTCRRWAVKYGRIYIVCGPLLYRQEHKTIGEHNVVVPEAFFKVILRLGDNPACIGYVMKNGDRGKRRVTSTASLRSSVSRDIVSSPTCLIQSELRLKA